MGSNPKNFMRLEENSDKQPSGLIASVFSISTNFSLSMNLENLCNSVQSEYHRAENPILPAGTRSPK